MPGVHGSFGKVFPYYMHLSSSVFLFIKHSSFLYFRSMWRDMLGIKTTESCGQIVIVYTPSPDISSVTCFSFSPSSLEESIFLLLCQEYTAKYLSNRILVSQDTFVYPHFSIIIFGLKCKTPLSIIISPCWVIIILLISPISFLS